MRIECHYTDPPHFHEWPDDWKFGGANGLHPGADPRWKPTTYTYLDERLQHVHVTQTPLCLDQAIDEFTKVRNFGPDFKPKYLTVMEPGQKTETLVPIEYDWRTDEAVDTQPRTLLMGDQNDSSAQEPRAVGQG